MTPLKENGSIHARTALKSHPNCAVCGADDPLGLGLEFQAGTDGSISLIVHDGSRFQGYPNRLHGGIISMLFDAAMTHCLFAHGLTGVTASLTIRFLRPVTPDRPLTVRSRMEKQRSRLYLLKGTLHQDGELKSTAGAEFWLVSRAAGYSE